MQDFMPMVKELINGETTTAAIIFYILSVIALWRVFKKAGERGWTAFIPILHLYKISKIADGHGLKFILYLIPGVNVIYYILVNLRMARAFGKGTAFGLGLIFLNVIFVFILGLGPAKYIGPRGHRR